MECHCGQQKCPTCNSGPKAFVRDWTGTAVCYNKHHFLHCRFCHKNTPVGFHGPLQRRHFGCCRAQRTFFKEKLQDAQDAQDAQNS